MVRNKLLIKKKIIIKLVLKKNMKQLILFMQLIISLERVSSQTRVLEQNYRNHSRNNYVVLWEMMHYKGNEPPSTDFVITSS